MPYVQHDSLKQKSLRKSLRMQNYDYRDPGIYFVTICTGLRKMWLGQITDGDMSLSLAGAIVQSTWTSLPDRFPGLALDQWVIMPNHVHGLIVLTEDLRYKNSAVKSKPTLSDIIDTWKGVTTRTIRTTIGFHATWQKSFHDSVIRNERMLNNIRRYIITNPKCWRTDSLYGDDA